MVLATSSKSASIGSMSFSGLRGIGQPPVGEPAVFHPTDCHRDKLHGIHPGSIRAEGELVDIPIQMFRAHVMVDTVVSTLQQVPKALDPVSMHHPANKFANTVIYYLMLVASQSPVGLERVSANSNARLRMVGDEFL